MVGGEVGLTYEVVLSRTRYVERQLGQRTRISDRCLRRVGLMLRVSESGWVPLSMKFSTFRPGNVYLFIAGTSYS
jgi:hypothetical protein